MSPPIPNAAARQTSGEPLSVVGQTSDPSNGWRSLDMTAESEIAGLADRPTHELRLAWQKLYRREPPVGLSRDLIIRALANKLQERIHGGPSRAMKRCLNALAGEFEKSGRSFNPGAVLKTGARLVRQWRGRVHAVLVLEDGFEYEGQRYRSLTMIAARITGAHWSGPRFFGVTKRTSRSLYAAAPR
jgi:Protein of unknown function (DUF2924)